MAGTDGDSSGGIISLPRRVGLRILHNFRQDMRGLGRKGRKSIPSAAIFFLEKWLAFWAAIISSALLVGGLGMGLVTIGEEAGGIPLFATNVPWLIEYVIVIGLLVVLTWGVMLISILLVSGLRLLLWGRNAIMKFWNRHTPTFSGDIPEETSLWPPDEPERNTAWGKTIDFFGKGGVIFVFILFFLFSAENIAPDALNELLTSSYLTALGDSLDMAFWIFDFESLLGSIAPGATQAQIVLFIIFFLLPAAVMAIGARNFLFLLEAGIRDLIDEIQAGSISSWQTVFLLILLGYSIGLFVRITAVIG